MFTTTTGMFIADQQGLVVNVADFGVVPSASAATNDKGFAAAIAAVAAGGVILVPYGIYKISQSIIIDNDAISLVALGQRVGATQIQIDSSADPTYALIVGNTKNVSSCLIHGLAFIGKNSTSSTGKGILFRSGGGKISQVKVALFGGAGVTLDSVSGTNFENFVEDLELIQNGMNSTTPDDNLVINGGVSDCEYHRVISQGNSGKSTTRHCINNNAGEQKFVDCHCYFASHDGFSNNGNGTQIIGGEYETNGTNGIESSNPNLIIKGIAAFGNLNTDISAYAATIIDGCVLSSTGVFDNIYTNAAGGGVIANNILSGPATGVFLDTGAAGYSIHDNVINASTNAITGKMTGSAIHDNVCLGGSIVEQTGAQNNDIHDNFIPSGKTITIIGTQTKVRNNPGYNPIGQVTAPGFPATTVAATNTSGVDVTAFVANGTSAITVIQIAGAGGSYVTTGMQIAASAWAAIRLPVGSSIKFTYAAGTPTWTWFGD